MPRAIDLEEQTIPGSHYGYSAVRPETLGASEYTIVDVILDESGSTYGFKKQMEDCVKAIVRACKYSPRADNLLFRLTAFGSRLREVHGYKTFDTCNEADYDNCYQPGGATALFDASENGFRSASQYAKQLAGADIVDVNAIVVVLTDGDDNVSTLGPKNVREAQDDCVKNENMESVVSILVGVNVDATSGLNTYLDKFHKEAGFTEYRQIGEANDKTIAKLAKFVSQSISSQSTALGSGGPSKAIASLTI